MKKQFRITVWVCFTLFFFGCEKFPWPGNNDGNDETTKVPPAMVFLWNEAATEVVVRTQAMVPDPPIPPFVESRYYAMVNLAMHDALNAVKQKYESYASTGLHDKGADPQAAVAQAAHDVIISFYRKLNLPAGVTPEPVKQYITNLLSQSLEMIPAGKGRQAGIELGKKVAAAIVSRRSGDGSESAFFPVAEGNEPGEYRYTPPFNIPGLPIYGLVDGPGWPKVKPFLLKTAAQFRPPAPYPISSDSYTTDFNEVKKLGCANCPARTAEQTEIALFWKESSPLAWNKIARTIATQKNKDAWEVARLFALLQMGQADAYIGVLEAKYYYFYWRPVTAIHLAGNDDNSETTPDASWEVLGFPTPPIPDYSSAHACAGGSASSILEYWSGSDKASFTATSSSNPATRKFNSFSGAAMENAVSRIYIGYHFRKACMEGLKQGQQIGNWVGSRGLQAKKQ